MKSQHLTCQHFWITTKLENFVQCVHCGWKKEIEPDDHDDTMKPEQEHQESA